MYLSEPDYLPQQAGGLFPGPWLVFAPHPDDESYGMGGAIARARDAGIAVTVIVLTDGRLGGSTADVDLVARREVELRAALAALGGADCEFWREPDRSLAPRPELINRARTHIQAHAGGTVFFPAFGEPHPDHRAAAVLVWEALRSTAAPVCAASYEISVQAPCNRLLDISPVLDRKCAAMAAYTSQEAQRPYAERVLALNRTRSWSLSAGQTHAEAFYLFQSGTQTDALSALDQQQALQRAGLHTSPAAAQQTGTPTIASLQAHCARLEAELAALQASRSWRLTAPLRALLQRLRGGTDPTRP